ncbi:uncharacterized protein [Solanum tuberosum]|uniref:uncharacterized protein isoform X1 n=1 Tax=Solanum tuberosum TaxID=4113 RepID=UPI000739F944|nr:PREDICTED: uncharacterized protein LOC107058071 isoform X1 [Solanum tuberosum]
MDLSCFDWTSISFISLTSCGGVGHILRARLESSSRQACLVACSPFMEPFILFTGTAPVLLKCLHQTRPSYSESKALTIDDLCLFLRGFYWPSYQISLRNATKENAGN